MCSPECCGDSRHQPEHQLFVAAAARSRGRPDYPLVMPVRLLTVLETASREVKDRLGRLMDHLEDRRSRRAEWDRVSSSVVQPILRLAEAGGRHWTEDQVQRCIGITRINGVSCSARIGDCEDSEQGEVRMLYPGMSVFSHSCSPNTQAGGDHLTNNFSITPPPKPPPSPTVSPPKLPPPPLPHHHCVYILHDCHYHSHDLLHDLHHLHHLAPVR